MNLKEVLRKLEGVHTLKSIMSELNINSSKAIYYIHLLRKEGYVKTRRLKDKTRVYNISFLNKLKGTSYEEIINQYSPVKIASFSKYRIYGKSPTLEETLIYAIKTKSLRTILAAMALFKKINNWKDLYRLAKANHMERQVGALYDLARQFMRTKRISKTFIRNALPKKEYDFRYFIFGLRSSDFVDIEKKWRVYLPFNKKDLEEVYA